jgi:hypothetical protein
LHPAALTLLRKVVVVRQRRAVQRISILALVSGSSAGEAQRVEPTTWLKE